MSRGLGFSAVSPRCPAARWARGHSSCKVRAEALAAGTLSASRQVQEFGPKVHREDREFHAKRTTLRCPWNEHRYRPARLKMARNPHELRPGCGVAATLPLDAGTGPSVVWDRSQHALPIGRNDALTPTPPAVPRRGR